MKNRFFLYRFIFYLGQYFSKMAITLKLKLNLPHHSFCYLKPEEFLKYSISCEIVKELLEEKFYYDSRKVLLDEEIIEPLNTQRLDLSNDMMINVIFSVFSINISSKFEYHRRARRFHL